MVVKAKQERNCSDGRDQSQISFCPYAAGGEPSSIQISNQCGRLIANVIIYYNTEFD